MMDWQIWTRHGTPTGAWSAVGRRPGAASHVLVWRSVHDGKIHEFSPVHTVAHVTQVSGWLPVTCTFRSTSIPSVMEICDAYVAGQCAAHDVDHPCAVHAGEVHGGEAAELRTRIESLVESYRNDWDLAEAAEALQAILDDVDARDSLAHAERVTRKRGAS